MSNIYICSFASFNLCNSAFRFYKQALDMGIFEDIFIYNECNLDLEFKRHFRDKIYKIDSSIESNFINTQPSKSLPPNRHYQITKGFGYWSWKPQIILQSLEKIQENDILIYADIGDTLVKEGVPSLLKKLEVLKDNALANFYCDSMNAKNDLIEKIWCKGDVFKYFGVLDNPAFTDTGTAKGGTLFMRKCDESINFIKEWLEIFWNHFNLVDDSPSVTPNFPEFRENRHDQTILSMLAKKHKIYMFKNYHTPKHDNIEFGILDTHDKFNINLPPNEKGAITRALKLLGKVYPNRIVRRYLRALCRMVKLS